MIAHFTAHYGPA